MLPLETAPAHRSTLLPGTGPELPPSTKGRPVTGTDLAPVFLQFGAVGAIALLAIYAVAKLFGVNKAASDAAIAAANARADRLEKQLADLNTAVIEKFLPATLSSTQVMGEVLVELRRDNNRGRS